MGPKLMVCISEPAMAREILNNHYQFHKSRGGNPLSKLVVKGIFDAEGDQWAKHRKIINPAFHVEKIKHMIPAFYVSCREMIDKWEEMLFDKSSCEVDVWHYLETFTSDVISRTAFGSSYEQGRRIFELQTEQAKLLMEAYQVVYFPGFRFVPTKRHKRMKEIDREVKALIRSIINKRVALIEAGETSKDDLLGILLDSNYKYIKEHENKSYGLSIEEVVEECKLFYFAGQETTGNMLVWTMVLLSQHIDWQTRAREEVLHLFGKTKPDIDGLNQLKTISMILNEVSPLFLHHDRDIWGDDAKEFNPERFSKGISHVTKGQASYIPFGGGARICIGQNFGMLEAKMALAMILQNFSFELSSSYAHAPHDMFTLQPQFGAHLILHKL
nr:cytochrome P450 CYP72A219-like [Tanacetum cinerariifolium]